MQTFKGQLEIDNKRGVIYFQSNEGRTILRICSLPKPVPTIHKDGLVFLDITHLYGTNWKAKAVQSNQPEQIEDCTKNPQVP